MPGRAGRRARKSFGVRMLRPIQGPLVWLRQGWAAAVARCLPPLASRTGGLSPNRGGCEAASPPCLTPGAASPSASSRDSHGTTTIPGAAPRSLRAAPDEGGPPLAAGRDPPHTIQPGPLILDRPIPACRFVTAPRRSPSRKAPPLRQPGDDSFLEGVAILHCEEATARGMPVRRRSFSARVPSIWSRSKQEVP